MLIPRGVISKNEIGARTNRRNILFTIGIEITNTINNIEIQYLLCSTRPAFKHINSVIKARTNVTIKRTSTLPINMILNMMLMTNTQIYRNKYRIDDFDDYSIQ